MAEESDKTLEHVKALMAKQLHMDISEVEEMDLDPATRIHLRQS